LAGSIAENVGVTAFAVNSFIVLPDGNGHFITEDGTFEPIPHDRDLTLKATDEYFQLQADGTLARWEDQ
jgi:hypothetical protein